MKEQYRRQVETGQWVSSVSKWTSFSVIGILDLWFDPFYAINLVFYPLKMFSAGINLLVLST